MPYLFTTRLVTNIDSILFTEALLILYDYIFPFVLLYNCSAFAKIKKNTACLVAFLYSLYFLALLWLLCSSSLHTSMNVCVLANKLCIHCIMELQVCTRHLLKTITTSKPARVVLLLQFNKCSTWSVYSLECLHRDWTQLSAQLLPGWKLIIVVLCPLLATW